MLVLPDERVLGTAEASQREPSVEDILVTVLELLQFVDTETLLLEQKVGARYLDRVHVVEKGQKNLPMGLVELLTRTDLEAEAKLHLANSRAARYEVHLRGHWRLDSARDCDLCLAHLGSIRHQSIHFDPDPATGGEKHRGPKAVDNSSRPH